METAHPVHRRLVPSRAIWRRSKLKDEISRLYLSESGHIFRHYLQFSHPVSTVSANKTNDASPQLLLRMCSIQLALAHIRGYTYTTNCHQFALISLPPRGNIIQTRGAYAMHTCRLLVVPQRTQNIRPRRPALTRRWNMAFDAWLRLLRSQALSGR